MGGGNDDNQIKKKKDKKEKRLIMENLGNIFFLYFSLFFFSFLCFLPCFAVFNNQAINNIPPVLLFITYYSLRRAARSSQQRIGSPVFDLGCGEESGKRKKRKKHVPSLCLTLIILLF